MDPMTGSGDTSAGDAGGRYRTYAIAPQSLLLHLTDGGAHTVVDGIPKKAELRSAGYDPRRNEFFLTVEHESFDPVPDGDTIPEGTVTMKTLEWWHE